VLPSSALIKNPLPHDLSEHAMRLREALDNGAGGVEELRAKWRVVSTELETVVAAIAELGTAPSVEAETCVLAADAGLLGDDDTQGDSPDVVGKRR
jgi:hypothetical protein